MSEFETPPQTFAQETLNEPIETSELPIEDSFRDAQSFQDNDFNAEAARRAQVFNEPNEATWSTGKKIAVGAGIVAGATGVIASGGALAYDHFGPQTVIAQETATIQPGEGVAQAVDTGIEYLEQSGVDPADISSAMRQDVISQAVELTQENGVVQPGQNVEFVATESPFGTLSVEAVAPQEQPISQPENESQELTAPDTH
jgi:hypothetical protein